MWRNLPSFLGLFGFEDRRSTALALLVLLGAGFALAAAISLTHVGSLLFSGVVALLTAGLVVRMGMVCRSRSRFEPDGQGIYTEIALRRELEGEIARSTRYSHSFAVVIVTLQKDALRFDYSKATRPELRMMTQGLLQTTREKVDKIFRYRGDQFCLVLPESDQEAVLGLVRRIRRHEEGARPGADSLPLVYGATFFPSKATTPGDLIKRAQMAVMLAQHAAGRVHLDGAEAEALPPGESLRRAV